MGTRSDFYIMDHDGSMEWIGSGFKDGSPVRLPISLIIQTNKLMFEEAVFDYLHKNNGIVKFDGKGWEWPWADSRMTDYTYIFHICTGKVLMCKAGSRPVDALKILQGMDMIGADVGIGTIKFPVMRKEAIETTEELLEDYGPKFTEVI